jgi:hypothetical protein
MTCGGILAQGGRCGLNGLLHLGLVAPGRNPDFLALFGREFIVSDSFQAWSSYCRNRQTIAFK